MAENPFFNTNLLTLGGQMAQTWQKALEGWWQGLLGDRDRLKELARQLEDLRGEVPVAVGGQGELAKLVEALELLQKRQEGLEEQVKTLTENMSAVITYLEKARADAEGAEVS